MTAYKVLADALVDVAARLVDAADELRDLDLEPEPDDDDAERARTLARDRMRRYRARRGERNERDARDVTPRNRDVTPRNRDVTVTPTNSTNFDPEGPSRPTDRQGGRVGRDDERPVTPRNSDVTERNARDARDARDRYDDQPANPWDIPPIDDAAREFGQARIRELRAQLHERRGGGA